MVGIGTFIVSVALAVQTSTVPERWYLTAPTSDSPTEVFGALNRVDGLIKTVRESRRRKTPTPDLAVASLSARQPEKRIGVLHQYKAWATDGPWGFGTENRVAHRE